MAPPPFTLFSMHQVIRGKTGSGALSKHICSMGQLNFARPLTPKTGTEYFITVTEQGRTEAKYEDI